MTNKQSKPQRSRNIAQSARAGALVVLAGCFALSAVIRTGEVIAALPKSLDDGFGNPIPQPDTGAAKSAEKGGETPVDAGVLVAELQRQRKQLQERESKLDAREQKLQTLEKRLRGRLKELREAREHLAKTASIVDDAAGKDVRRLADMYQKMKPKQAGQIFNEMAPSFAAGFIAQMRPDAAALIMSNMDPSKAYAVSVMLAGRNVKSGGTKPTE